MGGVHWTGESTHFFPCVSLGLTSPDRDISAPFVSVLFAIRAPACARQGRRERERQERDQHHPRGELRARGS